MSGPGTPLFEQIAAERLYAPAMSPPTEALPAVPRGETPTTLPAVLGSPVMDTQPGADDERVERTWNGLRPDDLALPQPPQDPAWRPDAHG